MVSLMAFIGGPIVIIYEYFLKGFGGHPRIRHNKDIKASKARESGDFWFSCLGDMSLRIWETLR